MTITPTTAKMRMTNNKKQENEKSLSGCPYSTSVSNSSSKDYSTLLQECPAFQKNSGCPFKNSTSPKEIQQELLKVPPSHLESKESPFHKALEQLHKVATTAEPASQFELMGGCPMQTYHPDQDVPFTQALEEWSLASIMAKMANDLEKNLEDSDEENNHDIVNKRSIIMSEESSHVPVSSPRSEKVSLAHALKTGTASAHEAAEDVHFVRNFIRGDIDRDLYRELVMDLYFVYQALEDALDKHAPTYFGSCHFPNELERTPALLEDVDFWHGSTDLPSMSEATRDYVDRIRVLADTEPLLLLSHAYTRYLGDLSGGKVLARVARRSLHLDRKEKDGLAFYHFDNISSAKLFKDKYRQALDDLPLDKSQVSALVKEANIAFLLNMRIFQELDVKAGIQPRLPPLEESLAAFMQDGTTSSATSEAECPFANKRSSNIDVKVPPNNECPFAKTDVASTVLKPKGKCPWPFILAHDPQEGLRQWQTWLVLGAILCWSWSRFVANYVQN